MTSAALYNFIRSCYQVELMQRPAMPLLYHLVVFINEKRESNKVAMRSHGLRYRTASLFVECITNRTSNMNAKHNNIIKIIQDRTENQQCCPLQASSLMLHHYLLFHDYIRKSSSLMGCLQWWRRFSISHNKLTSSIFFPKKQTPQE